ncbi:hypothetical protein T484DRAFT_1916643 [Baffinella frigidus]|nr:hypothetical protein T484DRAFT_1916643 [Cryptophyta sp. CCMP2293]
MAAVGGDSGDAVLEELRSLLLDLEDAVGGLGPESVDAGSVGIALEGRRVVGLMPLAPAFDSGAIAVGDEIVSVDGEAGLREMIKVLAGGAANPREMIKVLAGGAGSEVRLEVRRVGGTGEVVGVQLVRAPASRLKTEHVLALTLNDIYTLCCDDGPGDGAVKGEVARRAASAVDYLKELHRLTVNSEARARGKLLQDQQRLSLSLKQVQERLHRLPSEGGGMDEDAARLSKLLAASHVEQERGRKDRDGLLGHLQESENLLKALEGQLQNFWA